MQRRAAGHPRRTPLALLRLPPRHGGGPAGRAVADAAVPGDEGGDVPSAGYKAFAIRSGRGTAPQDDAAIVSGDDGSVFENGAVRLVMQRDGAIRSLIDVTISNPDLAFAKLGRSTVETLDAATSQVRMLAGGQVDGSRLGIPAQAGQRYFRQRFALEHQNPLVAGRVTGRAGGASGEMYPATTHSLLAVSHPDVLLWALKVHEDGIQHGLVARVWNLSGEPAPTKLVVSGGLTGAKRLTHVETPIEPLALVDGALHTTLGAQRMETFALHP